ncbi:MAG: serpin family protein [Bacilli bacterium]|nr:serpin family protein [Bacilli bacterium]
MDDIKQRFQEDFEKAHREELRFDHSQLTPNTKKDRHGIRPYKKGLIIAASVFASVIVTLAIPLSFILLRIEDNVKTYQRSYSRIEIAMAETNTFKKLSEVSYPDLVNPTQQKISEQEKTAYEGFANETYHALLQGQKQQNVSYSIAGLYSLANELSLASSRPDLTNRLDALLGLGKSERATFYKKVVEANCYARENATTQLRNAAFFNDRFPHSDEYVNALKTFYCESYQLHLVSDAGKIVEWGNKAMNTNGFIDEEFLGIDEETELLLFSTLYFKNGWATKYLAQDNEEDVFHCADGKTPMVTYMHHTYLTQAYYDYGNYVAIEDQYNRGSASVTYLVPKSVSDDIYELTKGVNVFFNDPNKYVKNPKGNPIAVHLKTPKFVSKAEVDFKAALFALGLDDMFDRTVDSFKNAILAPEEYKTYVQQVKQRNEVEFNEDGSIVKSVAMARMGAGGSAGPMTLDSIDIALDQPFIYIIKDVNGTPIFLGHVDNPNG